MFVFSDNIINNINTHFGGFTPGDPSSGLELDEGHVSASSNPYAESTEIYGTQLSGS